MCTNRFPYFCLPFPVQVFFVVMHPCLFSYSGLSFVLLLNEATFLHIPIHNKNTLTCAATYTEVV